MEDKERLQENLKWIYYNDIFKEWKENPKEVKERLKETENLAHTLYGGIDDVLEQGYIINEIAMVEAYMENVPDLDKQINLSIEEIRDYIQIFPEIVDVDSLERFDYKEKLKDFYNLDLTKLFKEYEEERVKTYNYSWEVERPIRELKDIFSGNNDIFEEQEYLADTIYKNLKSYPYEENQEKKTQLLERSIKAQNKIIENVENNKELFHDVYSGLVQENLHKR